MSERDQELVAYLLDELDDGDRAELEARLATDPDLRGELDARRDTVARLRSIPEPAWDPAEPPPLALPVSDIPAGRPGASASPPRRPTVPIWARWALGGFAVAALAAVAIALTGADEDVTSPPDGTTIALRPVGEGARSAHGDVTVGAGDVATMKVSGLPPSGDDFYELWLLGDDGLVSLASFRVDSSGVASLEVPVPVDPSAYEFYDVSVEPDDGDPAHSGDSVLRGRSRA